MVRRLVSHDNPEARETPLLLLAALREIDPTVELVYAGEGRWWLGAVSDNEERRRMAALILSNEEKRDAVHRNRRNIMLGKLQAQGFALIETYIGPDPTGVVRVENGEDSYQTTILADFQFRDDQWRKDQGASVFAERLAHSAREPQKAENQRRASDYLHTDGRDQYRRHVKNRLTVGYEGNLVPAGSTSLIEVVRA